MNNKIVKLSMVLFVICAITAGILGIVNALTWERIDQITHQKEYEAYAAVLGSESGYTAVDFDKTAFPSVDSVNQSNDGNGYVVTSTFSGAQGSITMACGVGNDLKCTGISIIEHSETSGLGAVAASASDAGVAFREQFIGVGENVTVKDIDAIAGATITSTAVTNAVATSITTVKTIEGGAAA